MIIAALALSLQTACLDEIGTMLFDGFPDEADSFRRGAPSCLWPHAETPVPAALYANAEHLSSQLDPAQSAACAQAWDEFSARTAAAEPEACGSPAAPEDAGMIARCRADQGAMARLDRAAEFGDGCDAAALIALYQSVFVRFEGAAYLQNQLEAGAATPDRSPAYWSAAYYLAQHAEMAPEIQEPWLEAVSAAVAAGAAEPYLQAGLADRLSIAEQGRQLYGTHTTCVDGRARIQPVIDDIETAAARRAAIGLPDLHAFLEQRSRSRCTPG